MRAKFGRGPTVVSKKGSLKFISRLLLLYILFYKLANLFVEKFIRPFWLVSVRVCGAGIARRGSIGNFYLSMCLSWIPGAYGRIVPGAV